MSRNLFPQFEQSYFPDPRTYDFPEWVLVGEYYYHASNVVTFGTALRPETVVEAYGKGIFPWHMPGVPLPWYCPERRAILEFDELRIARSLRKEQRKALYTFTIDQDFRGVVEGCASTKRPDQRGTWITRKYIDVYSELWTRGVTHSVEAWSSEGRLVGGLYGVDADGVFCGESMFYTKPNASKLALLYLIDQLKERGAAWLDVQVMTPHMEALGAKEIPRGEFLAKLRETRKLGLRLFSDHL